MFSTGNIRIEDTFTIENCLFPTFDNEFSIEELRQGCSKLKPSPLQAILKNVNRKKGSNYL